MNPYREAPPPDLSCPRCAVALQPRSLADVRLDECPDCAGVFVAAPLVTRISDGLDLAPEVIAAFPPATAIADHGGPMYLKCPRCKEPMTRRLFADGARVVVDICRADGVWFDDAELRAVAVFAESGGMEHAAEREEAERQAARAREAERAASLRTHLDERGVLEAPLANRPQRSRLLDALVEWLGRRS